MLGMVFCWTGEPSLGGSSRVFRVNTCVLDEVEDAAVSVVSDVAGEVGRSL